VAAAAVAVLSPADIQSEWPPPHDGQKCATVGGPRLITHICLFDKIFIYL
jgi:hypothetical protein